MEHSKNPQSGRDIMAGRKKLPGEERPQASLQLRQQRHDAFTPAKQDLFFATLALTANVAAAARVAKIGVATVYRHKSSDAAVANRWRTALADSHDELARLMLERALSAEALARGAIEGSDDDARALAILKSFPDRVAEILFRAHHAERREIDDDAELENDEAALAQIEARLDALRAMRRKPAAGPR